MSTEAHKAIGAFEIYNVQADEMSAPTLVESIQLLEGSLRGATPGRPVIAPSPRMVIEHSQKHAQKFGGVSGRIWMPEEKRIIVP